MKDSRMILRVVKDLIEREEMTIVELRDRTKLNEKNLDPLLRILQFLNLITIRNKQVNLTSQAYSLLFDPIMAHEGTELFFESLVDRNKKEKSIRQISKIPALLVPLLLLRSVVPYFGLILRDLEKDGKLRIKKVNRDFLFEYFSPFEIDFKNKIKSWKFSEFTFDEFYDLWIEINKQLPSSIKTKSNFHLIEHEDRTKREEKTKEKKKGEEKLQIKDIKAVSKIKPQISDRFFGIPKEKLEHFFGASEEVQKGRKQILLVDSDAPSSLVKLLNVNVQINNLIKFTRSHKRTRGELVVKIYRNNIVEWNYEDSKGTVPSLFILEDGIYGEKKTLEKFSEDKVKRQVFYLERIIDKSSGRIRNDEF